MQILSVHAYKFPPWAHTINLETASDKIKIKTEIKCLGEKLDQKLPWKARSFYLHNIKLQKQNYLFYHLKNYFKPYAT